VKAELPLLCLAETVHDPSTLENYLKVRCAEESPLSLMGYDDNFYFKACFFIRRSLL